MLVKILEEPQVREMLVEASVRGISKRLQPGTSGGMAKEEEVRWHTILLEVRHEGVGKTKP